MLVAFITGEGQTILDEDVDRPLHEESFAAAGVALQYRDWSDPSVDWDSYDLVVIRSPWDYTERQVDFMRFLDRVGYLETLHNPADLIRWNLDKRYLLDLEGLGVPVVPTIVAGDTQAVEEAIGLIGDQARDVRIATDDIVIKPVVSAGSRLTGWFKAGDPEAMRLAEEILAEGGTVLIEPFITSVGVRGEVSLVIIDGEVSHALRKGPLLERGGGLIGGVYSEVITAHEPSEAEMQVALAANDAAMRLAWDRGWIPDGTPLLYGRFDVVELDDGSAALLEAELFEPSLFLHVSQSAADRFTRACIDRVGAR